MANGINELRVYEYEDQYGNVYWSFRKPDKRTDIGIRLTHRGWLGRFYHIFLSDLRGVAMSRIWKGRE